MDKRTVPHKQNIDRRMQARELKQSGLTYKQIGEMLNVSRQRVQQLVALPPKELKNLLSSTNGICSKCNQKKEKLHIHHTDYLNNNTIIVCTACHRKLHNNGLTEARYNSHRHDGSRGPRMKPKDQKKFPVMFALDNPTDRMLDELAAADKISRSQVVRNLIEQKYLICTGVLKIIVDEANPPQPHIHD